MLPECSWVPLVQYSSAMCTLPNSITSNVDSKKKKKNGLGFIETDPELHYSSDSLWRGMYEMFCEVYVVQYG